MTEFGKKKQPWPNQAVSWHLAGRTMENPPKKPVDSQQPGDILARNFCTKVSSIIDTSNHLVKRRTI
jgi:hypothetical protein